MSKQYKSLLERLMAFKLPLDDRVTHPKLMKWDEDVRNDGGLTQQERRMLARARKAIVRGPLPDVIVDPGRSEVMKRRPVPPAPDPVVVTPDERNGLLPVPDLTLAAHPDYKTTPLQTIYNLVNDVNTWSNDDRLPRKAYLMACFSELAYIHIVKTEYSRHNRYKIFPSEIYEFLLQIRRRGVAEVLFSAVDMPVQIFERPQFIYFVFKLRGLVVIAVRGTDFTSLYDWRINLDAKKSSEDLQGYHFGFLSEAKAALGDLVAHVGSSGPVYFTGHSLGGAVASLLGEIWPELPKSMTPYVFASPTVTTPETRFVRRPYAYAFPNDLVPHLPFKWAGFDPGSDLPELIPPNAIRLTTPRILLELAKSASRVLKAHKIESYRTELGKLVDQNYSEFSYKDAIVDWIGN